MTDESQRGRQAPSRNVSPALVAFAAWVLPGAGYLLLGGRENRKRGIVVGITIFVMVVLGILIGGIRVIDVPGYDRLGGEVRLNSKGKRIDTTPTNGSPEYSSAPRALTSRGFFGEIANKPWYVGQVLVGPTCLIASKLSLAAARNGIPMSHARLYEIGTLYAAVAGMLNLLVIIDAAHRAGHPHSRGLEVAESTRPAPAGGAA